MASESDPITIDPAEAADDLKRIVVLNREITQAKIDAFDKADAAKSAKKRVEALQDELNDLIADISTPRPLLAGPGNGGPPPPGPGPEPGPPPAPGPRVADAWRGEPITVLLEHGLTPKQVDKLTDAGITTLGALADLGDGLTGIKGVGPSLAEKIADAATSYYTSRPAEAEDEDAAPPDDDGPPETVEPLPTPPDGTPRPFVVQFTRKKAKRHVVYARSEVEALHYACDQLSYVDGVVPIADNAVLDTDVVAEAPEGYGADDAAAGELVVEPDPDADAGPDGFDEVDPDEDAEADDLDEEDEG